MGTSKKNEEEKRRGLDKRTPAQAAFEKMQEKRVSWVRSRGTPRISRGGFRGRAWRLVTRIYPRTLRGGRVARVDVNYREKLLPE